MIRLSLVVPTIGRVPEVLRLAGSLAGSPAADRVELIVVDQSPDQRVAGTLAERPPGVACRLTTSAPGVSAGRNAGLRLAAGDLVGFPNDTTWYPPATLPAVLVRFDAEPALAGLAAIVTTAAGRPALLRWPRRGGPVRPGTVHRAVISPALFVRRALVDRLGGFDERLGTGGPSAAQSGEEGDLVLRALAAGARIRHDPAVVVLCDEPRDRIDGRYVPKMAGYGVGQGLLWRRHHLPAPLLAGLVARKLVAAPVRVARGQATLARSDLAWARGCLSGYFTAGPAGEGR